MPSLSPTDNTEIITRFLLFISSCLSNIKKIHLHILIYTATMHKSVHKSSGLDLYHDIITIYFSLI